MIHGCIFSVACILAVSALFFPSTVLVGVAISYWILMVAWILRR